MITNCKQQILGAGKLWDQPIPSLLTALDGCLKLNEIYQDQYRQTKEKLMAQPKGKQFDFSENQIFGTFELFCKRVQKLVDMFSTIQQFTMLAKHNIEGMDSLIENFFKIVDEFKRKPYDLLDFTKNQFDRDFLEFNVSIHELETALQGFINASFENIMSTEHALGLLKQFQAILQRDSLQADLDSKYMVIFHNYGLDLETVQKLYEKYKNNPQMARNSPPVAGNIQWARLLLRRIEEPMRKFQTNKVIMSTKESKKVIKTYNKVARALIEFETLWHYAWGKSVEAAKAGLQATLIIRHPENGHLYVNFDREILQLIRETKCLQRIGVDVPDSAKMVLLQEDKFKNYHNQLSFALREYERVVVRILPVIHPLLQPHMDDLERKIQPGMATLTWTSMNIDSYLERVHKGIAKLEELVNKINDIVDNRIEANLREIGKSLLVDLPADESVSLDAFMTLQDKLVKQQAEWMDQKNYAVENAVRDLLQHAAMYRLGDDDGEGEQCEDPVQSSRITKYYSQLMYRAILNATKNSFLALKKRIGTSGGSGFLFVERPFFDVDVELTIPNVSMNPSLDDIQKAVNHTAVLILNCSKKLWAWGSNRSSGSGDDGDRKSFHDWIARDQQIVKMVLLLTGSIEGTKNQVMEYLETFRQYDWLWKNDMNAEYHQFTKTNPTIESFEGMLKYYMSVEQEIMHITPVHNIGALSLETQPLKYSLKAAAANWKTRYATNLHVQAKEKLAELMEYINSTRVNLGHDINDLEDVRVIMGTLKEIRDKESEIDLQFGPVEEMYSLLAKYEVRMPKAEIDQVAELRYSWRKLRTLSTQVTDKLSKLQVGFKRDLVRSVKSFVTAVSSFRTEFESQGPTAPGPDGGPIAPMEAVDRLKKYENLFADYKRKWETYGGGEDLFGLPKTEYPELVKTEKELQHLSRIYSLYVAVINTINGYNDVLWVDIVEQIDTMGDTVGSFQGQMKKLPLALRTGEGTKDAYEELRQTVEDFLEVLPLLQMLSNEAMRPRHWADIQEVCGVTFKMDAESFRLSDLMEANLLKHQEDVEDFANAAVKELQIEVKLAQVVEQWEELNFDFSNYKNRGPVLLQGVPDIMEAMEETQMTLGGMMSSRYVMPFKEEVSGWVQKMSTVAEIIEQWVIVQNYWTYMEAVFSSGDIAKQLPQEAKRFAAIDKNYMKVMTKAFETPNVVQCCCGTDLMKNLLPHLNEQLELCQKSLTGYLESKRNVFARFYFVSDPVLLEILSQGSQPELIQQHLPTVLDSVAWLDFDPKDQAKVIAMQSGEGEKVEFASMLNVQATGNVEDWLGRVVVGMQTTMKEITSHCSMDCSQMGMTDLIAKYPAQTALLGIQFLWTQDCEDALSRCRTEKGAMQTMVKRQASIMNELIALTTGEMIKRDRKKLETMITIQVHQKDTSQDLISKKIKSTDDFEWQRQCRFYYKMEVEDGIEGVDGSCVISVTDVDFECCYEYCGVKERLCITPLTDRCYVTLAQALGFFLGGAPAGPAGTGKTETVKDLGRTLALWVVVTNCSDQMDYKACGKIFKGLSMSGAWGCFDEFNRIDLEVLSVVASQVACVLTAQRERRKSFVFTDGQECSLNPKCGFFITMNPGYAGRQELPENLKSLFRGVAMMVPNRQTIMVVKLASAGYFENVILGKKFHVLYRLCEQQLSKQTHYDFGLRNILSVLRTCGTTKRSEPEKAENLLFMRTVRDMNLSKFVAEDVPLYLSLIADTFPGLKAEKARYMDVEKAIEEEILDQKLQMHEPFVDKVVQLYETYNVRHGIMVVGPAGCGKTKIWQVLAKALTRLGTVTIEMRMNPKAITAPQMFGQLDASTNDWTDGIFSALWRTACKAKNKDIWLMADGPVDAIWIENLNTVLDDNKLLTLANGDRLMMGATMKMCFEPDNLLNASPATVSRAGIIFVSDTVLDWFPPVQTWLASRSQAEQDVLTPLFQTNGGAVVDFVVKKLKPVMFVPKVAMFASACALLEALLLPFVSKKEVDTDALERYFLFSLIWSIGGMLELPDRIQLHEFLKGNMLSAMPVEDGSELVYEYYVDSDSGNWVHWNTMIPTFDYDPSMEFSQAFVPTLDSTRYQFLLELCTKLKKSMLIIGDAGTTKTATINNFIGAKLAENQEGLQAKNVNFSFYTTHNQFQLAIESVVEKRQGTTFGPAGGKTMFVFVDDLSMPEVNNWGDQPTNEIVRQLLELGKMYNLEKPGAPKKFEDLLYYAAMAQPGGGKNDLPNRLKRQFVAVNMTLPAQASIDNIFGSILRGRFNSSTFDGAIVTLAGKLTDATILFWEKIKAKMLPTPAKFHYLFNMRDLSRVFQGVMQVPNEVMTDDVYLCKLWKHECQRVFQDKLTTLEDKDWVVKTLEALVRDSFGEQYGPPTDDASYFCDFLRPPVVDDEGVEIDPNPKCYEMAPSMDTVRTLSYEKMLGFNESSKILKLDLVLFDDALAHLMRVSRIIGMNRGSALLVGVGGSGKQSLTRLASFIAGNFTFQVTITKTYNQNNLFEDMKVLFRRAGVNGEGVSFMMTDAEVKEEGFLEHINNLLNTGEIPGMFPKDEIEGIVGDMRAVAKKEAGKGFLDTPDNLYKFFVDRVRDNLHVVLCFSPIGEKFRNRARMFPGLFNCCSIDWVLAWPQNALAAVAAKFMGEFELDATDSVKREIIQHCAFVHQRVTTACDEYYEKFRRQVYVTPKSYLTFIEEYQRVYKQKYSDLNILRNSLKVGLDKLLEAGEDVAVMKEELKVKEKDLEEAQKVSKALLVEIQASTAKAEKKKNECAIVAASAGEEAGKANEIKTMVETDLLAAKPALDDAENALNGISAKDIQGLKALKSPPEIIQRIMDTVLILTMENLNRPIKPCEVKGGLMAYEASYKLAMSRLIQKSSFLDDLKAFPKEQINDETVELLFPYLEMPDFTVEAAAKASGNMAGLCAWCRGMATYQQVAKVVGPKMEALKGAERALAIANKSLAAAQGELAATQAQLDAMQEQFDAAMAEKKRLQDDADTTKKRMDAANALINGLSGERTRWTQQLADFAETISRLVGDVALGCSFISYCGPYNQEFRTLLLNTYFYDDCVKKGIPVTPELDIIPFLTSEAEMGEWNLEGLPTDGLSIQNGILVTRSSRWPLLIDPQGQAHKWISSREAANDLKTTQLAEKMFRNVLEDCMSYGKPMLIENVEEEIDPVLDPVLLKQIVQGRTCKIILSDKECDYNMDFTLALTTKLPNPHFTPELSAKVTVIDFTVTMGGLEDQLLGVVIQKEKPELEEQRSNLLSEVNANKKTMKQLEDDLLFRLSNSTGNLLDDTELITVLANTKKTSTEVAEKLKNAAETEKRIMETREEYRPVAIRGSVLYFLVVGMTLVNNMYNTSLAQFMELFLKSIDSAGKAPLASKRINNIIEFLTYCVYAYIQRGLFEAHKLLFTFLCTMRIAMRGGPGEIPGNPGPDAWLSQVEFDTILKGGAALDIDSVRKKPFNWLPDEVWLNCIAASDLPGMSDFADSIYRSESLWKQWYDKEAPESEDLPDFEQRVNPFQRALIIRLLRHDRAMPGIQRYVKEELGQRYVDSIPLDFNVAHQESTERTPFICLLSAGADPTQMIEDLAKKKKKKTSSISMGQGQEVVARRLVTAGVVSGDWVILQNTHLGMGYLFELEQTLVKLEDINEEFRVFITCEPHPKFPIGLLQMSIKITNEAPAGIKAGLKRSYHWLTQDWLDAINRDEWRRILYIMCFVHSIVQERRKFGSIGWAIPYEYNQGDLTACTMFLQNHMSQMEGKASKGQQVQLQWGTVQYMVSEVQYGGRITDDVDRVLMATFCEKYFCESVMKPEFKFAEGYTIPSGPGSVDIDFWRAAVENIPETDSPGIFGMHVNADITFRNKQTKALLDTIIDTQPKSAGGGGGLSREEVAVNIANDLLSKLPDDYDPFVVDERVTALGGKAKYPLNVVLAQEIDRMQRVISLVRVTLKDLKLAVAGTIIMGEHLIEAVNSLYDARAPPRWVKVSWVSPTSGLWFSSFLQRVEQLTSWLMEGKPYSFWLTGFFNPNGFITATLQTVARAHQGWALDEVVMKTEATRSDRMDLRSGPDEGVYVHGLWLDGCGWNKKGMCMIEQAPKTLFYELPVLLITGMLEKDYQSGWGFEADLAPKVDKNFYSCPLYMYPRRCTGALGTYIAQINLNAGGMHPSWWCLRGVCLLCSKD
jgi:dynein heavy chain